MLALSWRCSSLRWSAALMAAIINPPVSWELHDGTVVVSYQLKALDEAAYMAFECPVPGTGRFGHVWVSVANHRSTSVHVMSVERSDEPCAKPYEPQIRH
jgi:hypothetical protein